MVFAVVKRYEHNGVEFADWAYRVTEYYNIYDKVMELTNGDHEESSNAASWCELATEGEVYEFHEGEIEIQVID